MSFPEGSIVLHVGPHKTGTTTLQAAFHQNRERLAEQGVHYAGKRKHSMIAAMAAASGNRLATAGDDAGAESWRALVAEVRGSDARQVVLSSEFYSEATPERIRGMLDELGVDRVHVVITLRPLVRIIASQWQQFMQNRPAMKYDDDLDYPGWLDEVLNRPDEGRHGTPAFWRRHHHDAMVEKWASVVGRDRLTVVVVDDSDKQMLPRAFEDLLGLEPDTLVPRESGANRSLTYPEVQLLTAFNRQYVERGFGLPDYTKFVRFGAARFLQERRPEPEEARLRTPRWAVERAAAIGAEAAVAIRATGVRVIGDLDLLGDPEVATGIGENDPTEEVSLAVVARLAAGLVKVAAELPAKPADASRRPGPLEVAVRRDKADRRATRDSGTLSQRLERVRRDIDDVLLADGLGRLGMVRVLVGRVRRRLR